ncbi:protein CDV3 homolog isoform X2 [Stigmatopora argus]
MADVSSEKSLDDFFAKRDKKKKKDKGKAKESSSSSMVLKKTKKENEKSSKGDGSDPNMEKMAPKPAVKIVKVAVSPSGQEDEEWKEFEQKEVDYSGLRLQSMQISDEKDEEEYEDAEQNEDEDGDAHVVAGGDKVSGPWNKSTSVPAPPPPPVEEAEVPESKPSGVYRPPGARLPSSRRGPTQGPPEIFNDAQFPSLMATGKHVETRRDREMEKPFEVVKHKGRGREDVNAGPGAAVPHLQLDNQYAVLGDK